MDVLLFVGAHLLSRSEQQAQQVGLQKNAFLLNAVFFVKKNMFFLKKNRFFWFFLEQ